MAKSASLKGSTMFPINATSALFSGMMLVIATIATAQDFRIETEVFSADAEVPGSQNLTIFTNGTVYDFQTSDPDKEPGDSPQLIVVWQRGQQQFVVLDVERQVKTIISHDEVLRFNAQLQASTALREKEGFLFHPKFETRFDDETSWLTLSSEQMTYQAKGEKPKTDTAFRLYHDFANWYARLNAVDPRKMPPFARLQLNKAIEKIGVIPTDVKLAFKPSQWSSKIKLSSRHFLIWKLSNADQKRIQNANLRKIDFGEVSLQKFYQVEEVSQK